MARGVPLSPAVPARLAPPIVSWGRRREAWYASLGLPAVVLLGVVTIAPFFWLLVVSFTPLNLAQRGTFHLTGLGSYLGLLTDASFISSLEVQARLSFIGVTVQLVLGIVSAVLVNQNLRGTGVFRTLLISPMLLPPVVVAIIWKVLLSPDISVVSWALTRAGLPAPLWLTDPHLALWSIIIADTWEWTPFVMLILLSGLQYVPSEPQEAALTDGATHLQKFLHVTLPLLRPVIVVAALFRLIDSIKTFPLIFIMTYGGPGNVTETTNYYAYLQGFTYGLIGYASRVSIALLILTLILSVAVARRVGETVDVE